MPIISKDDRIRNLQRALNKKRGVSIRTAEGNGSQVEKTTAGLRSSAVGGATNNVLFESNDDGISRWADPPYQRNGTYEGRRNRNGNAAPFVSS